MKRPTGQAHWSAVPPWSHCVRSASPEENAARIVQAMRLPSVADALGVLYRLRHEARKLEAKETNNP